MTSNSTLRTIAVVFGCIVALLISGCTTANSATNNGERRSSSKKNTVYNLVSNKEYGAAKDRLYRLYENFPNSNKDEEKFKSEIATAAYYLPKKHKAKLEAFLLQYGDETPVQHLQARRLQLEGVKARGSKFVKDTPEEDRRTAAIALTDSARLFVRVLAKDPANYLAHGRLAVILSYISQQKQSNEHFERALDYSPANYHIWEEFLVHNKPRWGGSHEKMEDIIFQMEAYENENPKLRRLKGLVLADKADIARRNDQLDAAEKFAIAALEFEPHKTYGQTIDQVYHAVSRAGDTQAACRISKKVNSIYPDNKRYQDYVKSCQ